MSAPARNNGAFPFSILTRAASLMHPFDRNVFEEPIPALMDALGGRERFISLSKKYYVSAMSSSHAAVSSPDSRRLLSSRRSGGSILLSSGR